MMSICGNWEKRRVETFERLGSMARRSFARSILTWATELGSSGRPLSQRITVAPSFSDYPFSLGIASGDPRPHGVVLWTRLAPEPLAEDGRGGMPGETVPVRWEVADDENFSQVVGQGTA